MARLKVSDSLRRSSFDDAGMPRNVLLSLLTLTTTWRSNHDKQVVHRTSTTAQHADSCIPLRTPPSPHSLPADVAVIQVAATARISQIRGIPTFTIDGRLCRDHNLRPLVVGTTSLPGLEFRARHNTATQLR